MVTTIRIHPPFTPHKISTSHPAPPPSLISTSLGQATHWLLRISQLCGATPLIRSCDQPARIIVHCCWTVALFAAITTSMVYQYTDFDVSKHYLEKFLYTCSYCISTVNNVVILLGTQRQRKSYGRFELQMAELDGRLERIVGGRSAPLLANQYEVLRGFVRFWLLAIAGIMSLSVLMDLGYNDWVLCESLRSCVVYVVPNVTICLILLQFGTVLRLLTLKYAAVNAVLLEFMAPQVPSVSLRMGESHLRGSRCEATLNAARLVHFRLNRLNGWCTGAFGCVLVTVFVWTLLVLTIQLYQLYKIAESFERRDNWLLAYTVVWSVLYGGRMLAVLVMSDRLNREKRKAVALLYRLDLSGGGTAGLDQGIHKFSLQILLERRFQTACAILQLDLTLVATIVGALTSYLVILIQFDSSTAKMYSVNRD